MFNLIYVLPAVLIAISLHEFAHGLASYKLGDPTPRVEGRLSVNPFKHLDLLGTLALIFFGFGWAKPVSVNPRYYENQKAGMVKVALAGPLMNFFVAFVCLFIMVLIDRNITNSTIVSYFTNLLYFTAAINIGLGVFNLIPIPPLDGSKVVAAILPSKLYFSYMRFEMYGSLIIILLLYMGVFNGILVSLRGTIMNGMDNIINNILRLL